MTEEEKQAVEVQLVSIIRDLKRHGNDLWNDSAVSRLFAWNLVEAAGYIRGAVYYLNPQYDADEREAVQDDG